MIAYRTTALSNKPQPRMAAVLAACTMFMVLAVLSTSSSYVLAQDTGVPAPLSSALTARKSAISAAPSSKPATTRPEWKELTPSQQLSLKPLAANWASMGEAQKRKWLAISKNYPSLPLAEQIKLHSRMADWVTLTRQQRAQARLNFAETKKMTPAEKTATWQAYQALSPEDKQQLAAKASLKEKGAAVASQPVPSDKLAHVPVSRIPSKQAAARIAASPQPVDRNTLLPLPPGAPVPGRNN